MSLFLNSLDVCILPLLRIYLSSSITCCILLDFVTKLYVFILHNDNYFHRELETARIKASNDRAEARALAAEEEREAYLRSRRTLPKCPSKKRINATTSGDTPGVVRAVHMSIPNVTAMGGRL